MGSVQWLWLGILIIRLTSSLIKKDVISALPLLILFTHNAHLSKTYECLCNFGMKIYIIYINEKNHLIISLFNKLNQKLFKEYFVYDILGHPVLVVSVY